MTRPTFHRPDTGRVTSPEAPRAPGKPVVGGLDGLRAVAVLAVMAFHAGVTWAGGGLLGVDVFFVISGYLVTSLLVRDRDRAGRVDLRRFWVRRAKRLLPALLILLGGMALYARWDGSGLSPVQLRGDALGTLAYAANWHYILTGQNYFVRFGAPSPLLHTWSLAVEEQFYLIWPLIALVVLKFFSKRALAWTGAVIGAASAALCAGLYLSGASVDRLYYGTDTRAQSLMIGAVLAFLLPLGHAASGSALGSRRVIASRRVIGVAGLAGAVALGYLLHAVTGNGPFLYEGGFLVVGLCAAAVVALTVRVPDHPLCRILSWAPLRYIGRISYGLYLYHWPLFLVLNEERTGLNGNALLAVRFAATFAVAAASFHLIENPVRTGRGWVAGRLSAAVSSIRRAPVRAVVSVRGVGIVVAAGVLAALVTVTVPSVTGSGVVAASASTAAGGVAAPGGASPMSRAVLIGDSMALTLGEGLTVDSGQWGVDVENRGVIGCDLDPTTTVNVMGTVSKAAQGCPDWRASWTKLVAQDDPDEVVVLLGRWETIDRLYDGRWTTVGDPAFDQHLQAELAQVVQIGSARGARVVFLTLPYISQVTEQPDGSPWDMNLPSRTDAYNADVRAVVARYPKQAATVDLNKMLDPGGHYVSYIGKVRVRDYDDEHLSVAGGEWLRGLLLPELRALSPKQSAGGPAGAAGGSGGAAGGTGTAGA